jgi:drug/metabolite transporter (DMT)-like permease
MKMATTPIATHAPSVRSPETLGLLLGLLGVLAFSLTLPMTRYAVGELDPWFLAFGRMAIAGILAAAWLAATGAARPARGDIGLLAWSALGIVIGFPLLSSLALRHIPANHGAIIVGLLPFATSLLAALVFKERQPARFWICAAIGSALVITFALRGGDDRTAGTLMSFGNLAMLAAVFAGAVGYVAGARLTARLGGVAAILWALVFALPLTLPAALALTWANPPHASLAAWSAFAYVTLVSQVIGFFAWYNGLALGGIARVGQVQLLQAFFTIGFAALLFGEHVSTLTWLFAIGVVATIALGRSSGANRLGAKDR